MSEGRAKLVVASNRGPFTLEEGSDGSLNPRRGGGGLAPSLAAALAGRTDTVWVAAALSAKDRTAAGRLEDGTIESGQSGLSLLFVDIDEETLQSAYDVIANTTLWFSFHGLFDASRRPLFDRRFYDAWERYRQYNLAFAEAVDAVAAPGAVVLVNDYHLLLAGSALAEARPDLSTVHFSHTPFPGPEELEVLPPSVRREILVSMGCFGACGFHTRRFVERFVRCSAEAGLDAPPVFHAGLGADLERLRELAAGDDVRRHSRALEERFAETKLVVRSDRIELSKNILRGLRAFDLVLSEQPGLRGRVAMLARGYPSREGLPEYLAYRAEVEHLTELVNERWATPSWRPVELDLEDDFAATVAALMRYDVLLVNPIRDGMNLVAKEGASLNARHGVLVLSRLAGAYEDLGEDALGIHPFDVSETADAIVRALEMPEGERRRRAAALAEAARRLGPAEWLEQVLAEARLSRPGLKTSRP